MAKDRQAVVTGSIGGNVTASRHDMNAVAARARAGLRAKFEREVDPNGELDPEELARRTDHAIRAYYARLSWEQVKRAQARKKKAGGAGKLGGPTTPTADQAGDRGIADDLPPG